MPTNYTEKEQHPDLPLTKKGIVNHYLFFHDYAVNKYSKPNDKPLVFMQVGSFYEAYRIKLNNGHSNGADVKLLSKILSYAIFEKYKAKGVGIPDAIIDEVASELMVKEYTHIIRVDEILTNEKRYDDKDKELKGKLRRIARVYTPGTFTPIKEIASERMVRSRYGERLGSFCHVYIKKLKQKSESWQPVIVAISSVDVNTGESEIYEFYNNIDNPNYASDELYNYLLQRKPSELMISSNDDVNDYVSNLPVNMKYSINSDVAKEYFELAYQKQALKNLFPDQDKPIRYIGLERNNYSIASFLLMVQYIHETYPDLNKNLKKPRILDSRTNVILANDAITQLGIYDYNAGNTNTGTVFDLLNECSTNMGSALLRYRLLNPIIDPEELEARYVYVAHLIREERWKAVEKHLKAYPDLVRMHRRIDLGIISPAMITNLHKIYGKIKKLIKLAPRCEKLLPDDFFKNLEEFRTSLEVLDFEVANKYNSIADIDKNIFRKGHNKELDKINKVIKNNLAWTKDICEQLGAIAMADVKTDKDASTIISIKYQAGGYHLTTTKTNYSLIESALEKNALIVTRGDKNVKCKLRDLSTFKTSKNRIEFNFPAIRDLSSEYELTMKQLSLSFGTSYKKFLNECSTKYGCIMYSISKVIAEIDLYKALAKSAVKYNYCRPQINTNLSDESFIISHKLRNPIVERDTSKEFIPYNVSLGIENNDKSDTEMMNGQILMIYGPNMGGKSVYLKSIGISVIMAQMGAYVPAENYTFRPFKSIYTRILTIDDQVKSMSSFEKEMIELAPMVTRSDKFSLVLADELAHSTTHNDACSIVAASILKLRDNGARGVMTTHLHELMDNEALKDDKISVYHVAVTVDNSNLTPVYNRKMIPGSGKKHYGIEIAAKLGIPQDIIKNAYSFRRELLGQSQLFLTMKRSNYNSDIFMDKCSYCPKIAEETHHHIPQKNADENGYVGHINIHSEFNLQKICRSCHDEITHKLAKKRVNNKD